MKPGNSDDNEPDKTEQAEAESSTAESSKAESSKADEKAEPEATETATESAAAEPEPETETKPEAKPETEPESKSESKSESTPESTGAAKPKARSKAEAKAAEAKAEAESDPEPLMVELEKAPPISEDEPVMPTAAEARRRRAELPRPRVLQIAFYLAVASLAIGVISVIDLFAHKAELVSGAQDPERVARPLSAEEAERAVSSLLWLYLVVIAALGAFLTLFAYKAQDGVRRARMLALIITLILLLFHFFFFGSLYGQVSGLLAAITIALMYLPSTREYFGPRQKIR